MSYIVGDGLHWVDWTIIILYLIGLLGMGLYLNRSQKSATDYYVGGRSMPWWTLGISVMATQSSAVSFLSIPAFVAIKANGGLTWLQNEIAVPIAMIWLMATLIPVFRRMELISVYEFIRYRFGNWGYRLISLMFLTSRGLGTASGLYSGAIVCAICLGTSTRVAVWVLGIITMIFDFLGGIKGVVYSDVLQMGVMVFGIITLIVTAVLKVDGGFSTIFSSVPEDRYYAMNIDQNPFLGGYPFWAFFLGGIVQYASYYGADQSQTQRLLAAKSVDEARTSLMLNGLARFPFTLLYCTVGMCLGVYYSQNAQLQCDMQGKNPDWLIPVYLLTQVPMGIRAVIIASILSASMSSTDSAVNSLSAVTVRDFIEPFLRWNYARRHATASDVAVDATAPAKSEVALAKNPEKSSVSEMDIVEAGLTSIEGTSRDPLQSVILWTGRITTIFWALFSIVMADITGQVSGTVIESINKIGSFFYGPILAGFVVGIATDAVSVVGLYTGCLVGVCINTTLWLGFPQVFYMWYNVTGFVGCLLGMLVITLLEKVIMPKYYARKMEQEDPEDFTPWAWCKETFKKWIPGYIVLFLACCLWITICALFTFTGVGDENAHWPTVPTEETCAALTYGAGIVA